MSTPIQHIVLIGGGLAAAKAAETLRKDGYDRRLTLITAEPERPYERPPLSKAVLMGAKPPDVAYVHPASFYEDHDIKLIVGDPASSIDRAAGHITTQSGQQFPFDRALLATGARPRKLPVAGRDLDGVVNLRTLADSNHLRERLTEVEHVTIIGAGWIGCEVAAAARTLNTRVTMIDPLEVPLQRVLGHEVGSIFAELHRDQGVDLRLGLGVATLHGGTTHVEQVVLTDGATVDTELVVVGVGVVPNVELAEQAGLTVDNGIVVDDTLATGDPRILAAGDVANAWHPRYGRRVRVEHWANALNQGQTAAANLLGAGTAYDRLPYFFTDQYDLGMEYVGHAESWDQVVVRGDKDTREFIAFWIGDGRVQAAMNVNIWDVVEDLKTLILSDHVVDPVLLADPDIPLDHVAPAG